MTARATGGSSDVILTAGTAVTVAVTVFGNPLRSVFLMGLFLLCPLMMFAMHGSTCRSIPTSPRGGPGDDAADGGGDRVGHAGRDEELRQPDAGLGFPDAEAHVPEPGSVRGRRGPITPSPSWSPGPVA